MKNCPACDSKASARQEPGEYAVLALTQGRLQIHLDAAENMAVVVRAHVCNNCGYVSLYESTWADDLDRDAPSHGRVRVFRQPLL